MHLLARNRHRLQTPQRLRVLRYSGIAVRRNTLPDEVGKGFLHEIYGELLMYQIDLLCSQTSRGRCLWSSMLQMALRFLCDIPECVFFDCVCQDVPTHEKASASTSSQVCSPESKWIVSFLRVCIELLGTWFEGCLWRAFCGSTAGVVTFMLLCFEALLNSDMTL